jgi:hypothetical protein
MLPEKKRDEAYEADPSESAWPAQFEFYSRLRFAGFPFIGKNGTTVLGSLS